MIRSKKGFSLLELILVLGVASAISFMKFQDLKHQQEDIQANAVGEQIKQVGDAVNGYINIRYDKLSTLTSVSSTTGTDPGPRTCSTADSTCTITYQTLINEGLLPSTFSGINAKRSGYNILLRRSGSSPNYVIDGLITTTTQWKEGDKIRYDLLGQAMQAAGVDSGMTKTSTTMSGYSGSWSNNSTDYSNISQAGLLGYRVGYDSAMYSVFLRRDGTLPMTGDLNMGSNSINNAVDINASGAGSFGGNLALNGLSNTDFPTGWKGGLRTNNVMAGGTVAAGTSSTINSYMNNLGQIYGSSKITSGGEVVAHNGYGDTISLGGDAAGNDYEIRLGTGKQLTIYSPNATSYSTALSVNRNTVFEQRIATNGLDPNNLPPGWGGGIRTFDVYASGTIAAGDSSGVYKAYLNANGDIYAGHDILSQHYIYTRDSTGTVIKAYLNSDGNVYASGNLQADGNITSSSQIISNSRLTTNEYLQVNGIATEGSGCSPNGLQGRSSAGALLSCTNGVWRNASALQQNACYWVGNSQGRDFTAYSCAIGEYVAGFQFVGHQHSESAYIVKCCK